MLTPLSGDSLGADTPDTESHHLHPYREVFGDAMSVKRCTADDRHRTPPHGEALAPVTRLAPTVEDEYGEYYVPRYEDAPLPAMTVGSVIEHKRRRRTDNVWGGRAS